jgi:uncharacterized membrane protein
VKVISSVDTGEINMEILLVIFNGVITAVAWLLVLILLFLAFATSPILPLYYLRRHVKKSVPATHYKYAVRSIWSAWWKNLLTMPFDLTAPVVVPIALLFTKWEAERLPRFFRMWDNEVNLNGDIGSPTGPGPVPLDPKSRWAIDNCYWAPGHHPRSRWARYVWIGLRNRASWPAWRLGYRKRAGDAEHRWSSGNPDAGKGWTLDVVGERCRFRYRDAPLRIHYGYKVGGADWQAPGNVVAIGFSLRKFK